MQRAVTRGLGMAALLCAVALPAHAADLEAAKKQAKRSCGTCHSFKKKDTPRQGPSLWGIVGREAGAEEAFSYSDPFLAALEGKIWTRASLDAWLADPKALAPGTVMLYQQGNPDKRALILDYLETLR